MLVASDTIGGWSSAQAGQSLAAGWGSASARVLPIGEAGAGFVAALADQLGASVTTSIAGEVAVSSARSEDSAVVGVEGSANDGGIAYEASSFPLGVAVAELVGNDPPRRLSVDLTGLSVHDGGAGLLGALGATADRPLDAGVAGLAGLTRVDLSAARALLAGVELVGVVPADQLRQPLTGLRGITSLAGRSTGAPSELMLSTDSTLERLAALVGVEPANQAGSGACGGLGLAVLALGGRLSTGPSLTLAAAGDLRVDLVVTGCSVFDFASRGGGVVAAVAEAAVSALSPCIVVAGEVLIGSREMRTMGIEAAYAVRESDTAAGLRPDRPVAAVTQDELQATARRVARSWSW